MSLDWLHWSLEGPVLGLVCVGGVSANALATAVLLSSFSRDPQLGLDLSPTFARLLVALMAYDSVFLLGLLSVFTFPLLLGDAYRTAVYPRIVPYALPVIQIALTGSVYMTMSLSVERYLSLKTVIDKLEKSYRMSGDKGGSHRRGSSTAANSISASGGGGGITDESAVASPPRQSSSSSSAAQTTGRRWKSVRARSSSSATAATATHGRAGRRWGCGPCGVRRCIPDSVIAKFKPECALTYILPIGVFSVLYNVTRFFELRTVVTVVNATDGGGNSSDGNAVTVAKVESTEMRKDPA